MAISTRRVRAALLPDPNDYRVPFSFAMDRRGGVFAVRDMRRACHTLPGNAAATVRPIKSCAPIVSWETNKCREITGSHSRVCSIMS